MNYSPAFGLLSWWDHSPDASQTWASTSLRVMDDFLQGLHNRPAISPKVSQKAWGELQLLIQKPSETSLISQGVSCSCSGVLCILLSILSHYVSVVRVYICVT